MAQNEQALMFQLRVSLRNGVVADNKLLRQGSDSRHQVAIFQHTRPVGLPRLKPRLQAEACSTNLGLTLNASFGSLAHVGVFK